MIRGTTVCLVKSVKNIGMSEYTATDNWTFTILCIQVSSVCKCDKEYAVIKNQ